LGRKIFADSAGRVALPLISPLLTGKSGSLIDSKTK